MNTFLKVLLIALAVVVAVKLFPAALLAVCMLGGLSLLLLVLGASAAVVVLGVAIGLITALSPLWLPVLAIVGIVALCRRSSRT